RCRSAAPRARRCSCSSGRHDIRGNCLSSSIWNKGTSIQQVCDSIRTSCRSLAGDCATARLSRVMRYGKDTPICEVDVVGPIYATFTTEAGVAKQHVCLKEMQDKLIR